MNTCHILCIFHAKKILEAKNIYNTVSNEFISDTNHVNQAVNNEVEVIFKNQSGFPVQFKAQHNSLINIDKYE